MNGHQLVLLDESMRENKFEKLPDSIRLSNQNYSPIVQQGNNSYKEIIEVKELDKDNKQATITKDLTKTDKKEEISVKTKKPVETSKKFKNSLKLICSKIVNSNLFIAFMTALTLFALFSNDIQFAWLPRSVDFAFDSMQAIMLFFFTLEIVMTAFSKKSYINSFFFWLDIIATVSLIQDISFIFNPLLGIGTNDVETVETTTGGNNNNNNANMNLGFLKVSSATRATRVLRIIRIIRLIRIVKLYKNAVLARENMEKKKKDEEKRKQLEKEAKEREKLEEGKVKLDGSPNKKRNSSIKDGKKRSSSIKKNSDLMITEEDKEEITIDKLIKESKISKVLSESITKKVIILILAMLIVMPIISEDFYEDNSNPCYDILAKYISNFKNLNETHFFTDLNKTIDTFLYTNQDVNYLILNITIDGITYYKNNSLSEYNYRSSELDYSVSEIGDVTITFSILTDTSVNGILGIVKTVYVCILLTTAAVFFENDTKQLVLEPLEVMIEIVENVSKDPINAKNIDQIQTGVKNTMSKLSDKKKKKEEEEKYEVKIIQSAIVKISALLAIGFGEAGGEIIAENLSSHQDLNAMLPGKRKNAIFGFCDVRGFPAVNEVLQEKTMVFINEVADIVHSSVDRYGGAANKNIGDAFLMVWKFSNDQDANKDTIIKFGNKNKIVRSCQTQADMAVLGYLKTIIRINKDNRVLGYKDNPGIKEKLPNYKVNMGFGLHVGWAIEGAVGSNFKMDASYLSPNVNMAARLEAATRQYGVTILISGQLHDFLSEEMKKICRHIDTVEVKGSKVPIRLYTIDVNLDLKPSKKNYTYTLEQRMDMYSKKKDVLIKELEDSEVSNHLFNKKTFKELLKTGRPKKFYKKFTNGMKNYIGGDWEVAGKLFNDCIKIVNNDKPTKVLLDYLKEHNFKSPNEWKGFRSLTSK